MDAATLNLILWIPFLAVSLITGLIFGINGFRKGIWRALISLGATAVAAVVSVLLAKLLAPVFVPGIMAQFSEGDYAEMGGFVSGIIGGVIQSVLSLVLYVVVLFICVIIMKVIGAHIKKQELVRKSTGLRFAGLGIRLVDSVLYTLLLLVPLYGTLAAYAPTAASLMKYVPDSNEYAAYIDVAANHPVVKLSGASPAAVVYKSLSAFQMGGENVNIAEISQTVGKTADLIEEVKDMSPEEILKSGKALEFVEHLQDDLLKTDWFYGIATETIQQTIAQLPEADDPETQELISFVTENLDMSKEDFQKNCDAVLDVVHLVLEKDLITVLTQDDFEYELLYSSGLMEKVGQMLNSSDQFLALKGLMYQMAADSLLTDAPELVQNLMKNYKNVPLTDTEQMQREVEAFIYLTGGDMSSVIQGFARHPSFGYEAVVSVLGEEKILEAFELGTPGSALATHMETHPEVAEAVLNKLKECSEKPLDDTEFSTYCAALTGLADLNTNNVTADALDFALDTLGEDYFGNSPLYQLLEECPAIMKENEEVFENGLDSYTAISGLNDIMNLTIADTWPEGEMNKGSMEYGQLKSAVTSCCLSDQSVVIINGLVSSKGNDPMCIGANLSAGQKTWLGDALDAVGEDLKSNSGSSTGDYNMTQNPDGSFDVVIGGGISFGNGDFSASWGDGMGGAVSGGFVSGGVISGGNGMIIVGGSNSLENVDETIEALEKFLGIG